MWSTRGKQGFILVELLVVIAIVALLMAILLPALGRVRRQAKAVVCQSKLKQRGIIWAAYCADNDGYFPRWAGWQRGPSTPGEPLHGGHLPTFFGLGEQFQEFYCTDSTRGIRCCPMATELCRPDGDMPDFNFDKWFWFGGTFLAWGRYGPPDTPLGEAYGSYGLNEWVYLPTGQEAPLGSTHYGAAPFKNFWRSPGVPGAANVPVYLDCAHHTWSGLDWAPDFDIWGPPARDAAPSARVGPGGVVDCAGHPFCMNRHDGFINSLFMDWSVRKVGLKQIWTLKWHRQFNTANRWTKAGGVQPEDWPKWMRHFKDY